MKWYEEIAANIIKENLPELFDEAIITIFFDYYTDTANKLFVRTRDLEENLLTFLVHLHRRASAVKDKDEKDKPQGLPDLLIITGIGCTKFLEDDAVWNNDWLKAFDGTPLVCKWTCVLLTNKDLYALECQHYQDLDYKLAINQQDAIALFHQYTKGVNRDLHQVENVITELFDFFDDTYSEAENKRNDLIKAKEIINTLQLLITFPPIARQSWFRCNENDVKELSDILISVLKCSEYYDSIHAPYIENDVYSWLCCQSINATPEHQQLLWLKMIQMIDYDLMPKAETQIYHYKLRELQFKHKALLLQFYLDGNNNIDIELQRLENEIKQQQLHINWLERTFALPTDIEAAKAKLSHQMQQKEALEKRKQASVTHTASSATSGTTNEAIKATMEDTQKINDQLSKNVITELVADVNAAQSQTAPRPRLC